jgi:Niemann-Pick C1 protein
MRRIYAPFLLRQEVKQLVLVAFGGLFLVAIIGIQHITLGLGMSLLDAFRCDTSLGSH